MPEKISEIVPPQDRLELKRHIKSEYENATKLLDNGNYKDALKKFKWVFSHESASHLSLSSKAIRKLIREYRPAIVVIKRWRNDKEKLILDQSVDLNLILQWNRLNICLGEKERARDVFLKLMATGADNELLHDILNETWQSFVRSKNYDVLASYLPTLGFHLLSHATEYDSTVLFPRQQGMTEIQQLKYLEYHVNYMLREGILIYEAALGLGNKRVAFEFARKILVVQTSDLVYAGLIKAAIRARAFEEAMDLFNEAKGLFSIRKLRNSSDAIKLVPKPRKGRKS